MRRDHGLTLQATLLVEPADKRHPLVFRSGLVIGTLLIERFDSDSSFKSIEACAGKVSVHQMAYHFNSLHFLGQAPGEPVQDALRLSAGQSPLHFQAS